VQQQTRAIPIVFIGGGDPAAIGLVRNIERPESNTTGFSGPEPSIAGKYLGLLKEADNFFNSQSKQCFKYVEHTSSRLLKFNLFAPATQSAPYPFQASQSA
jgi:ABC-type uncharacterized transport system substrate-binding protein